MSLRDIVKKPEENSSETKQSGFGFKRKGFTPNNKIENIKNIRNTSEPSEFEKWESDEYNLADLVINTKVCIHCMACKCRDEDPEHNKVFFPKEFSNYMSNPLRLSDVSNIIRRNPVKEPKIEKYQKFYMICLYNLMKSKCYNCKEGRCGKIKFDDNTELTYCYPDIERIKGNKVYIGLHLNILLKKEDNNVNVKSEVYDNVGQYLRQFREDVSESYDNEQDNLSVCSYNTSINTSPNILNNTTKDWVNILLKKENNEKVEKIDKEENIKDNNNYLEESITNDEEESSSNKKENDSNSNSNMYSEENHVYRSNCFMDYVYDENKYLIRRIDNLEDQVKELIELNKQMSEQIKFLYNKEFFIKEKQHQQKLKEYQQSLNNCNNVVSETVNKTKFEEYYFFNS